jgi:hypothetical protein
MNNSKSNAPTSVDLEGLDPAWVEVFTTMPIETLQWWGREFGAIAAERIACDAANASR